MELAEKIESALVAYLAAKTYPAYFVAADQVKPGEADEDISNQYVRCRTAEQAESEFPLDTGNFFWDAEVEVRTPAALQTSAEEASTTPAESTSQLDKHKAVATVVEDAILVDDLPTQLTAGAADFLVMAVQNRRPGRSQDDDVYSSGWVFRLYCCSRS